MGLIIPNWGAIKIIKAMNNLTAYEDSKIEINMILRICTNMSNKKSPEKFRGILISS